ncbi:hypothetical protein MHF_0493 [Mycoplasma haemofelis Ohio2]|uniref:Uncharacterized protein n=1 Tax=Mycoplasma haemofelis (strain Ohio2) TaxID=859194 RepID=F6FHM6_MYCHI|nr:hypothetical protein MHF_0493 [Mycoplasma haemofelis Ohio2]
MKSRSLDEDAKRKISENCNNGKTSYVHFEGGKWVYKFPSN